VLFVREVLHVEPDPWQEAVLRAWGRNEPRISIRSCHGPGKTAVAAWIILMVLLFRYPQKTVATAPTAGQLFDGLLAEVKHWLRTLPPALQEMFEVKSDRIELRAAPESSFFSARTSREEKPEALQGVHADHVMLVVDEGSGVHDRIYEAAAGSMSGENAQTLLLSNPVRTGGFFYDTHHKLRDMWYTVHVCAAQAVAPEQRRVGVFYSERVTKDFVEDMRRRYGEDSNAYRVRVLGEFPRADDDTLIPFELVEAATHREVYEEQTAESVWGLDVARYGDARSVLAKRSRRKVRELLVFRHLDLMQLCGRVKAEWDGVPQSLRPTEILVDVIGLGAGVVDRLRELKLPARGINVSESPAVGARFRNLRSELWFKTKEWFEKRDVALTTTVSGGSPEDDVVLELTTPRYMFTSSGKMVMESKNDMKKRGFPSPDLADAIVLTFAADVGTMLWGTATRGGWHEPLYRNIKGVV
jgi:phage terminase large subunit